MFLKKIYINKTANQVMQEHAYNGIPKEVGGFLLGRPCNEAGNHLIWVIEALEGDCESYRSSVVIKSSTYDKAWKGIEENGLVMVGWYHTHPGFGIFLSRTDVDTMKLYYNRPYNIAVVLDPINNECGAFGWKDPSSDDELGIIPSSVFIGENHCRYFRNLTNSKSPKVPKEHYDEGSRHH